MTTVRQLIENLMKTENLDGEVIYEYYTIENFEQTGVSSEVWTKVVDQYDGILTDDDKYSEIEQAIASA